MGSKFTIAFSAVSVIAQQDFFSWKALTEAPLRLIGCVISNVGIAADAGDAQEELLGIELCRGNTTIGSGGTNPTGRKLRSKDSTTIPTTDLRVNDTTKISGGTRLLLMADGFNVRTGWQFHPTPEEWFEFDNSDGYGAIQLTSTPTDAILFSGTAWLEQL